MLHLRTQYFLTFGSLGAIMPFQPMLLHKIGMSDWEIGLVFASPGIAALVAPLVMGYIADRHLSSRKILVVSYLVSAIALGLLFFLTSFPVVVALTVTINFLSAPALALLDVLGLHALRNGLAGALSERDFPLIRRWGSLGFVTPAFVLFTLSSIGGFPAESVYLVGAALSLGSAFLAMVLPDIEPAGRNASEIPTLTALRELRRPPLGALTIGMFIASIGTAMFYLVMPRYLQELGLSMDEAGLVITLGVFWEIALLSVTPRVLERFGARIALIAGIGGTAVRFVLLALFPTVGVAVATQVLHAPLVLVLAVVVPTIFTRAAAPAIRNSLFALALTIYGGVSRVIGPPIAGLILSSEGGESLARLQDAFLVGALFCALGALVFYRYFKDQPTESTPNPTP